MQSYLDSAEFEKLVREAEEEASKAGTAAKADWMHLTNTWRLLAERTIAERTGGQFPLYNLH